MKTLSSLGLGTSLIAATVTAATVVAVAPAQAAILNGNIGLGGTYNDNGQNFTNGSFTWTFENLFVSPTNGDFSGLKTPNQPIINPLTFTNCTNNGFTGTCDTSAVTPFIAFGTQTLMTKDGEVTADLKFHLDAGQAWQFQMDSSGITYLQTEPGRPGFTGAFIFNQKTLAIGNLTANFNADSKTYSMSIETKDVPEPLTLMGSGLALGFGGLFQRKNASKRKNQKSA